VFIAKIENFNIMVISNHKILWFSYRSCIFFGTLLEIHFYIGYLIVFLSIM